MSKLESTLQASGSGVDLQQRYVLGQRLDATDYADATARVIDWANRGESRYVCLSNVHMVMQGWDNPNFRQIINAADLITTDGVPLVWCLRALGLPSAVRVYGPDLTLHVCAAAAQQQLAIGLYGGTAQSLKEFAALLQSRFPAIEIACSIAPPFRPLTEAEDATYTKQLAESGARILFVGIGCPKQEIWMSEHRGRLNMPMLGVGAAFDFHAGRVKQAPAWLQAIGLEWLFRLLMEPRRLWRRYAWHNPRFVLFFIEQLLRGRGRRRTSQGHVGRGSSSEPINKV
ncbi:MAG: WecB/TagA/CpsF family glycosyltransferase [Opitutales bacterium]|jgi:N-acetylglucosaminyldiphosphoundecaprenol N-acetyl-beta-D-mannosaminyltransferase